MVFGGIQKLTLLDYPEKTACTIFTAGCNFRCLFCHNASLLFSGEAEAVVPGSAEAVVPGSAEAFVSYSSEVSPPAITESEILAFLETRRGLLDGVCISGGEPLLYNEPGSFIKKVKALGFLIKLDTNGSLPNRLEKLIDSGTIDYVAMDIKNTPEKYGLTIGLPDFDISSVRKSVELLLSGKIPYEFRTTVVRELHTADDLVSIARWISGAKKYYLQGFIDSEGVLESGLHGYSSEEMHGFLDRVKGIIPDAQLRGI